MTKVEKFIPNIMRKQLMKNKYELVTNDNHSITGFFGWENANKLTIRRVKHVHGRSP